MAISGRRGLKGEKKENAVDQYQIGHGWADVAALCRLRNNNPERSPVITKVEF